MRLVRDSLCPIVITLARAGVCCYYPHYHAKRKNEREKKKAIVVEIVVGRLKLVVITHVGRELFSFMVYKY